MTKGKGKKETLTQKLEKNKSFQEELQQTIAKILEYKKATEANIVGSFWKNPQLLYEYDDIRTDEFDINEWRVFYEIIRQLTLEEEKKAIDAVTVGFYLERHPGLKEVYESFNGYDGINKIIEYINVDNLPSYINDFRKWGKIKKLAELGYPVNNRLSEFEDKTLEEIYNEFEITLNTVFSNTDFGIVSKDISDGIDNLIEKLNQETGKGLPFESVPTLNAETGGMMLGDITLLGGVSNSGKSTFLRLTVLPTIIRKNERIVVFLNEEGVDKWQKELLIWVANNIFAMNIPKWKLRNGQYDDATKEQLQKCANYLKNSKLNKNITLIPLERYKTATVAKLIKKYASAGVKYFAIDTFKLDNADGYEVNDNARLQMVQNITMLYNVVKESCKNVHLICTVQLNKGSSRTRYLSLDNIGESKNIVDPCASAFFIRNLFDDEYSGGRRQLHVYHMGGVNGNSMIPVTLDPDKKYQLLFIAKSREAAAGVGSRQIVLEVDFSHNIIKEVGFTNVPIDF